MSTEINTGIDFYTMAHAMRDLSPEAIRTIMLALAPAQEQELKRVCTGLEATLSLPDMENEREIRKHVQYLKNRVEAERRFAALANRDTAPSWVAVDHDVVLDAARNPTMTEVGRMTGELPLCLFYRGKVNGVHAESEAGKSWLCCLTAVQEIQSGNHVLYLDFEDDAVSVYRRMKQLGATEASLRSFFHYVNPTGPLSDSEQESFNQLVNIRGSLAIVDGVTEAMALEGLDGRMEGDIAKWHQRLTKPLAASGWAVVAVDHIPHAEKRAIGSQHKRSAITGASYFLDGVHPIAPGQRGLSRLHVAKDRGGWVRAHATPGRPPQWIADMVIDCRTGSVLNAALFLAAPSGGTDGETFDAPPRALCAAVLAYVTAHPEATSKADIRDAVKGNAARIGRCIDWLTAQNHLASVRNGKRVQHVIGPQPFDQQEDDS